MVYIDEGNHLITDGIIQELHDFAAGLGLRTPDEKGQGWFQNPKGWPHPHYDIFGPRLRREAIGKGAEPISSREAVRILRMIELRIEEKEVGHPEITHRHKLHKKGKTAGWENYETEWVIGWRRSLGYWSQLHIAAYGSVCPHCNKIYPSQKEMEDILQFCLAHQAMGKTILFGYINGREEITIREEPYEKG